MNLNDLKVNDIASSSSTESNIDFDEIYPISSVYLSVNFTNLSVYFGGKWEQINDDYLNAGDKTGTASRNKGVTTIDYDYVKGEIRTQKK